MTVVRTSGNNVSTTRGNDLTLFVDLNGILSVKDYLGNIDPVSDYIVQQPSFDEVQDFPTRADFPATGTSGVIYVATNTDIAYTWNSSTNDYDPLTDNVGIGGLGNTPRLAMWTGPNTIGNSRMYNFPSYISINNALNVIDGNTFLSIQRPAGQAQLDFVIGNPGFDQPCRIVSTNIIDGMDIVSYGNLRFYVGTTEKTLEIINDKVNIIGKLAIDDGFSNLGIGANVFSIVNEAVFNIAIGDGALENAKDASQSIAIGRNALNNVILGSNVAIGFRALENTLEGNSNIAVGNDALRLAINNNKNIVIGNNTMTTNEPNNCVVIGNSSIISSDILNSILIGDTFPETEFINIISLGHSQDAPTQDNELMIGSSTYPVGNIVNESLASTNTWEITINGVKRKILLA